MSKISAAPDIEIRQPVSNIYTVLAGVGVVALILALICIWVRADTLFGGLLTNTAQ